MNSSLWGELEMVDSVTRHYITGEVMLRSQPPSLHSLFQAVHSYQSQTVCELSVYSRKASSLWSSS